MNKSKKIFVSRNQGVIDKFNSSSLGMLPYIKNIVSQFNLLEVGTIANKEQLTTAYCDPKGFYSKRNLESFELTEDQKQQRVNKSEVAKWRSMPDPQNFYSAVESANRLFPHQNCSIHHFAIDSEGKVVIDDDIIKSIIDENTVYAESEAEIKLHAAITKAAKALDEVREAFTTITGKSPFQKHWSVQMQSDVIKTNFIECEMDVIGNFSGQVSHGSTIVAIKPCYKLINEAKRNQVVTS
jgi:hypothetical protein